MAFSLAPGAQPSEEFASPLFQQSIVGCTINVRLDARGAQAVRCVLASKLSPGPALARHALPAAPGRRLASSK